MGRGFVPVYGEAGSERVDKVGLVKSNAEGRRLIKQGAVKVDADFDVTVDSEPVVQTGKCRFARILPG